MDRFKLRTVWLAAFALALVAIGTGCGSPAAPTDPSLTTLSESVESESDIRAENTYVIRDADTLRRVWQELFRGRRDVPVVDFSAHMVVIVALGERPTAGYTVQITGVSRNDRGLVVHVAATAPGSRCITAAVLSYPIAVARLRAFDGPVRFEFTRRTRDCTTR